MKTYQNLTESDIDIIDVESPLDYHIEKQELKDSGWKFGKIISMTVFLENYRNEWFTLFKINQLRSSDILNNENDYI